MSQPGINEPVTDGDSNLASSQPRPQDDACVDGESTNREPVGRSSPGKHPHPQEPSIVHVKAGKAKKRKQPSVKGRNVKSRSDDTSDLSTHIDPSLTQILGPSLNVMLATDMPLPDSDNSSLESVTSSPAATSSSSSGKTRANNKPTRYTAVKQQLKLQMEENERLIMSLRLLEQDIDDKNKLIEKLNKCDSSQKLEIKKLSKANDNMRRELSNYKDSNVDTQQKCNCAISCVPSDLADLKGHVASVAKSLLAAVSENGDDTGFVPVTNRRQKPTVVRASNTVSSQAPTERISSPLPVRANKAVPPARGRSSAPGVARGQRPTSATSATPAPSYRPSTAAPNKPSVAIIGTSLVRGLAHRVSKRGFSATSFMYPGSEIPVLRERVPDIFSNNYKPDVVVLQCAGNDVDNGHSVAQVVQQLDSLIYDIKSCCPTADIIVNKIPPRGHSNKLLETIDIVNKYISDMSQAKNSRVFSSDACPKSYRYYLKDEIHFNHKGKQFYAQEMLKVLNFPRLSFQQKR